MKTDPRSPGEHFREEDWVEFASTRGDVGRRQEIARHLEAGCPECERTVQAWAAVLSVADQEALARKAPAPLAAARRLAESVATQVKLVFDSFRQPELAEVRAAGAAPRQLLYKAGRYTIKLQVEPAAGGRRVSVLGQILDEKDPSGALRDVSVTALRGRRTLERTVTNHLGEFHLEPGATGGLHLTVDVPEIGTFAVPQSGEDEGEA